MTTPPAARHILGYAQTLAGGGVERALLRLAGLWAAAGRRVTLVIGDARGPLAAELPEGVERIVLDDPRYAALLRAVPRIVRAARPDVLFCPGNHYTSVAAWTRLRLGDDCPPIVAKVSNALVRPDMGRLAGAGYRRWLRLHPRFVDAVVAMTPGMAGEAMAAMRIAADRVAVIPNPPARPRGGDAPPLPPRYLIGVGRLARQKRWDRAIAALARAADRDVALVLLGEGEERGALERQVAALGLGSRVVMPGHVADPLPVIAGAAALVLASDFEGVPGVIGEALALGTPVVTTRSSVAIDELLTRPDQGSIVAADDPAALVAALDHWLAPDRARPIPSIHTGDPAADYLRLFDSLSSPSSISS